VQIYDLKTLELRLFCSKVCVFVEHLGRPLENYVAELPVPVHVYRTETRSGLIRARLLGAKHVKGQVITFLDAHCECTEGWLEPLLARIAMNRYVYTPCHSVFGNRTLPPFLSWEPNAFGRDENVRLFPDVAPLICLLKYFGGK